MMMMNFATKAVIPTGDVFAGAGKCGHVVRLNKTICGLFVSRQ